MPLTDAHKDTVLDDVWSGTFYLSLHTSSPSGAGAGSTEVSGGGYVRQAVTFDAAADGEKANADAVTFPTASSSWGTVTHFGLFSASSGGSLLFYAPLTSPVAVGTGALATFEAGDLIIEVD
jgi:hypothetical protein